MSTLRKARNHKQLSIEGLDEVPKLPADYAKTSWKQLKASLRQLISFRPMMYGREYMYQTVTTLCNNGDTQFILKRLLKFVEGYIRNEMIMLAGFEGEAHMFIDAYDDHWDKYQRNVNSVLSVFMFLDGEIKTKGDKGLCYKSDAIYRQMLVSQNFLNTRLVEGLMILIQEERMSEIDHKLQLKRIILMFEKLDLYKSAFYPRFLQDTDSYYAELAKNTFETSDATDYLYCVQKVLRKEQERLENYLGASSTRENIEKVENRMIKEMAENLLERGLKILITHNKLQDLQLLYKLLKQVDLLNLLQSHFSKVVKEAGLELVSPKNSQDELISTLLTFREKIETIMQTSFENNIKFKYSNKTVWEEFINTNPLISVLCSKDLDNHLKKNSKIKLNDNELEAHMDGIISIFKFINSKDMFEAFYFKQLAKRLLLDKSKSNDLEKAVIAKLKAECGTTFITRLRNIQNDIDNSKAYMVDFNKECVTGVDFHVWVLTDKSWTKYAEVKPVLPREFQTLQAQFTAFYTKLMTKRLLSWNSSLSYCELQCVFDTGTKSITVSMHQALILMLFNDKDSISVRSISETIGMPLFIAKNELVAICAKHRILLKANKREKSIADDEIMTFNNKFTHKLYKITINSLQIKETKVETQETIEKVMSERQYVIDAAIVRIMKTRKTINHSLLLSECFAMLRFNVSAADVKKRIERLIEQEFIRRDDSDRTIFHYIS